MSKSIVRSSTGPWGSVRVVASRSPSGDFQVDQIINGRKKPPILGLEYDEAASIVVELFDQHIEDMKHLHEATLADNEIEARAVVVPKSPGDGRARAIAVRNALAASLGK